MYTNLIQSNILGIPGTTWTSPAPSLEKWPLPELNFKNKVHAHIRKIKTVTENLKNDENRHPIVPKRLKVFQKHMRFSEHMFFTAKRTFVKEDAQARPRSELAADIPVFKISTRSSYEEKTKKCVVHSCRYFPLRAPVADQQDSAFPAEIGATCVFLACVRRLTGGPFYFRWLHLTFFEHSH